MSTLALHLCLGPTSLSAWTSWSNSSRVFYEAWCVPFLETLSESYDARELVGQESERQNASLERLG